MSSKSTRFLWVVLCLFSVACQRKDAGEGVATSPQPQMATPVPSLSVMGQERPAIPARSQRVRAFEQAGLVVEIAGMDELDRDLLFNKAGRVSNEELAKSYPKIPPAKLATLGRLAKGK